MVSERSSLQRMNQELRPRSVAPGSGGTCQRDCEALPHRFGRKGWVKALVPSEPQVIAGIYGCE